MSGRILMKPRVSLALSGGGFRASLFHLGTLRSIVEHGWAQKIDVISTVSGGSIVGAFVALRWSRMLAEGGDVAAYQRNVVEPFIRRVTSSSFITEWIGRSFIVPFRKLFDRTYTRTKLAGELYGEWFYGSATCPDLPERPFLILNATNLQSERAWRFTRDGLGDSRNGYSSWKGKPLCVGEAVCASAAFPPVFTPARIRRSDYDFGEPAHGEEPLRSFPIIALTDGGVYDNSGLEAVWKATYLPCRTEAMKVPEFLVVSDAGAPPQYHFRDSGIPGWSDALLLYRSDAIARDQVSALRRRSLFKDLAAGSSVRGGTYVMLGSSIDRIPGSGAQEYTDYIGKEFRVPKEIEHRINTIRTHLDLFSRTECEALMYHAYTMTNAFLWAHRAKCPTDYRVAEIPNPKWRIEFTDKVMREWLDALTYSHELRL
jgi:NTE family protein